MTIGKVSVRRTSVWEIDILIVWCSRNITWIIYLHSIGFCRVRTKQQRCPAQYEVSAQFTVFLFFSIFSSKHQFEWMIFFILSEKLYAFRSVYWNRICLSIVEPMLSICDEKNCVFIHLYLYQISSLRLFLGKQVVLVAIKTFLSLMIINLCAKSMEKPFSIKKEEKFNEKLFRNVRREPNENREMNLQLDCVFECERMRCESKLKGATKTKWVTHLIVYCFAQQLTWMQVLMRA